MINKQSHTIHTLLSEWGRSQQLPNDNQTIKNLVLNSFPVNPHSPAPSSRKRWWLPLTVAGLGLFFIIVYNSRQDFRTKTQPSPVTSSGLNSTQSDTGLRMQESAPSSAFSLGNLFSKSAPEIPITDTRQFLKTDYNAAVRTRHTQETTTRIQTMVRGYDGRIDNASSSDKYGSVTFVIPADKLESFRNELKALVGAKFISEQTSTENLLPQKQAIEQSREATQTRLTELTNQRDQLTATYNQTIQSIQSKQGANNRRLASLQMQWSNYPDQRSQLEPQINQAKREQASLSAQLAAENSNYQNQLTNFDSQIETLEKSLKNIDKQDGQLLNTVATVRGTITLSSMNLWQWVGSYLPEYWPLYLAIIAAVLAYVLHRRRSRWVI